MRKPLRLIGILFTMLLSQWSGSGQVVSIGFWNVENLYDTIPSLFYDDSDYTPTGRLKWGGERYGNKLRNLAEVIDHMQLDIIALSEVESEVVLRDLVTTLNTDYNYIHEVGSDRRGMDLALLYKGDKFVPERVRLVESNSTRQFLYIVGELYGERLDIVVCHLPSKFNSRAYRKKAIKTLKEFAQECYATRSDSRMVVMGDFNSEPNDPLMRRHFFYSTDPFDTSAILHSPLNQLADEGKGSYAYGGRWQLIDNIFLDRRLLGSGSLRYGDRCGLFVRDFMLDSDPASGRVGMPLRTFSGGRYQNGYSDHLPVYIYLIVD